MFSYHQYTENVTKVEGRMMKVKILTRINVENAEPDREPASIIFSHVEKIVVANDQMVISYTQVEKEGVQQLKIPVDKLYEAGIEFY